MKLSSIFGWKSRLRRLKIAAGETALAAKDRMQLLRLVANEEKKRLVMGLALSIVLIGLTTITVALVSVAIVVHYWDTPYRITAAWGVAGFWVALWVIAAALLLATLRKASTSLEPARREFERDWQWIQHRFKIGEGAEHEEAREEHERGPEHKTLSQDQLLARIATQRKRVATMSVPAPPNLPKAPPSASDVKAARRPPPANETPTAIAVRLAKENPVAAGAAAAAVVAVFGPRRLMRWAAVIAPIAWRMRG